MIGKKGEREIEEKRFQHDFSERIIGSNAQYCIIIKAVFTAEKRAAIVTTHTAFLPTSANINYRYDVISPCSGGFIEFLLNLMAR